MEDYTVDYLEQAMNYRQQNHEQLAARLTSSDTKSRREAIEAMAEMYRARREVREPIFQVPDKYEDLTPTEPKPVYPRHPKCEHVLDGQIKIVSYGLGELVRKNETLAGSAGYVSNCGPCRVCTEENQKIARQQRMHAQLAHFSQTAEVPKYARKFTFFPRNDNEAFPPHLEQANVTQMFDATEKAIAILKNETPFTSDDEELRSMFMYGNPGAGKSILAAMMMKRFMEEGFACYYVLVESYFRHLQRTFGKNDNLSQEERDYEENVLQVPVLVLDDMGTESPSDWVLRKIFTLIELRAAKGLLTIITSNDTVEALTKRWHKKYQDAEFQQMSARIQRRFNDYFYVYHIEGGVEA